MKVANKINTPEANLINTFDSLSQEFENGSFYGLQYILDDFFQENTVKTPVPALPEIDWFGLYQ